MDFPQQRQALQRLLIRLLMCLYYMPNNPFLQGGIRQLKEIVD